MISSFRKLLRTAPKAEPDVKSGRLPTHIAVIMDGNGRWAQRRGLPRIAGHRAGAKVVRDVVETAATLGIGYLTLYAFSSENWRRPKDEVSGLMRLFEEILRAELDELHRSNVKITVIGVLDEVSAGTRAQFEKAITQTAANTGLNLTIALNYSGRADILKAVNQVVEEAAASGQTVQFTEESFSLRLATTGTPDPELIIRTSGEMRLSNFLIWESAYAEFWVTDILWPDFKANDLRSAISAFQSRDRRFGGLTEEPSAR